MAQGLAGIPGAVARSFTWDVGNTFGTGKFGESVFGANQFCTPLITAGQIGLAVQKTYKFSEQVLSDLQASTNYSFGAVANWTYENKTVILKTVKEIIKFSLMFFFPGMQSLKTIKVLASLAIDIFEMELFWSGKGIRDANAHYSVGNYGKTYKDVAFMAAKIASVTASVFFAHGLLAKKGITAANKNFSKYAITLMKIKGACMYTGGVASDAWNPAT